MRVGSLCTGIGGLDLAVHGHFGGELAWYAEHEPAPCAVLEREWPGVPNLRDLTTVDWSEVAPVDILCAGYPCQPFSHAGKREGTSDVRHRQRWTQPAQPAQPASESKRDAVVPQQAAAALRELAA